MLTNIPEAVIYEICQYVDPISLQNAIRANSIFFRATRHPRFWFDFYNSFFQVPEPVPVSQCLNGTHNFFQLFVSRFRLYNGLYGISKYSQFIEAQQCTTMLQVNDSNYGKTANRLREIADEKCEKLAYQLEMLDSFAGDMCEWQFFASEPQNFVIYDLHMRTDGDDEIELCEFFIKIYDTTGVGVPVDVIVLATKDDEESFNLKVNNVEHIEPEEESLQALVPLAKAWHVPEHCSLMQFVFFLNLVLEPLHICLESAWQLHEEYFLEQFGDLNAYMLEMSAQQVEFLHAQIEQRQIESFGCEFFTSIDQEWNKKIKQ